MFSQDMPYASPMSPFDLLPLEGNPQTKEDQPDGLNELEPECPPVSAPITPPPPPPADNFVQKLVQALTLLGQAASATAAPPAVAHPTPTLMTTMRIQAPNPFDGSNLDNLCPFLLQCQLTFGSYPQQYATDAVWAGKCPIVYPVNFS